ncbi:MAG TPA: T9SS type A sorting domain-containing protein [Rubricoccaceae bacterium]|nr:T9SS type A sorting domain-containing protein [Rubricoccaceae bacterium]
MCSALRLLPVALGLLAGPLAPAALAQWAEEQRLLAADGAAGDFAGWSVDLRGGVAIVGAWGDDDAGGGSGSATVYRYEASAGVWLQEQKLTASDAEGGDNFGWAVAIDGDLALVGAGFDDDRAPGAGAAYVFRYDAGSGQWLEEQKLLASDGTAMDRFGHAVDLDGSVAVVGAAQDDDVAEYAGSAYVFRYDAGSGQWVQEQKLTASDGAYADNLGAAVSVSGDVILLGAESDDQGLDAGSAYVFQFDSGSGQWVETQKLLASDGQQLDYFGGAVALDGDAALIGAERDTEGGVPMGSATVFRYDGDTAQWVEEQELLPSDGAAFDNFGFSVALDGDVGLVGAFVADARGTDSGAAYVFRRDGSSGLWSEEQKLTASDGAASDEFGVSVALDGDAALVGASQADARGTDSGAAYVFRHGGPQPIEPTEPAGTARLWSYPNPFRASAVIAYTVPEAGAVRVAVYDVLGREVAVLVDGVQAAGRHEVTWDAGAAPSGVYVYRIELAGTVETRALVRVE